MTPSPKAATPLLHVATLAVLLGLQPLLSTLVSQPEFFVARNWDPTRVRLAIAFLTACCVVIPVLLRTAMTGIGRLLGANPQAIGSWFDRTFVALITMVWALEALQRTDLELFGVGPFLLTAVSISSLLTVAYVRSESARAFVTFLSPSLLAVPLIYSLNPALARLGEGNLPEIRSPEISSSHDVVLVIFDAFSMTGLVDADGRIEAQRYPNLSRLGQDATWFPNATSMALWTTEAIPALLTGEPPVSSDLPTLHDHPENLFTLLAHSHRIAAAEGPLRLCPRNLNVAEPHDPKPVFSTGFLGDTGLVRLHQILPRSLAQRLPRIDRNWANFLNPDAGIDAEIERFDAFLDFLRADSGAETEKPTFYYHHVVFPHLPHRYLPSGRIFREQVEPFLRPLPGQARESTEAGRIRIAQRYLLQVGLIDRMVGRLLDTLQERGIYDESTVILTADHGPRLKGIGWPEDIHLVPVWWKEPGTGRGTVDARPIATQDLAPTLLERLGARSLSEESHEGRTRSFFHSDYEPTRRILQNGQYRDLDLLGIHERKRAQIEWYRDVFGSGEDPESIFRAGNTRPDLVGEPVEISSLASASDVRVELDRANPVVFDPDSGLAPISVTGSMFLEGTDGPLQRSLPREPEVAVLLNGVIEIVIPLQVRRSPDWFRFQALVPESRLRAGENVVDIALLGPDGELLAPTSKG